MIRGSADYRTKGAKLYRGVLLSGNPGTGINFRGQVATRADLPSDAVANDGWQTLDTMDMWVWNGAVWINAGTVSAGPAGPQGPMFDIATLPPLPIL